MPMQKLKCRFCGAENSVSLPLNSLDQEGNHSSTILKSRRSGGQRKIFICTSCHKENSLPR